MFVDTHAHLTDKVFVGRVEEVISRAKDISRQTERFSGCSAGLHCKTRWRSQCRCLR